MGKENLDVNSYNHSRGSKGSYSVNYKHQGRELLTHDEIRRLDNKNALLFVRGEYTILDAKYDLKGHPNIAFTEDGGSAPFNYAASQNAHEDMTYDAKHYEDYEILTAEDILGIDDNEIGGI